MVSCSIFVSHGLMKRWEKLVATPVAEIVALE
jgi:hypothetical protein